jgi:hypothetical protein
MSRVLQYNYVKNFFKINQYLLKNSFNPKIIDYAEDNGHLINYIGFTFAIDTMGTHYILTSSFKNEGYRIITIKHSTDNVKYIKYVDNSHDKKYVGGIILRENEVNKNILEVNYLGTNIRISIAYHKITKFISYVPDLHFIDVNKASSDFDKHTISIMSYDREIKMYPEDIDELHQVSEQLFLSIVPIMEVFYNLKTIIFANDFNEIIPPHCLPTNVEYIRFGNHYDKHIGLSVLPSSLKILSLGNTFNWPIGKRVLPNLLEKLVFGNTFNQPITKGVLPKCLKTLIFGNDYNWDISDILPMTLKRLVFGDRYNNKFEKELPRSLKYLYLGLDYNKEINSDFVSESVIIYRN